MQTPTREEAETAAFRGVFTSTFPELVRYTRRRVAAADVDDVVSEVYLVAWRRWDGRPEHDRPLPWLYGIAANVVRNRTRADRRRVRLTERVARHTPPQSVAGPELVDSPLADALAELSFDDQELLRLLAWERLSHAEIATALGCSVNAVGIRAHRAKQRLAERLHDERRHDERRRQDSSGPGHEPVSPSRSAAHGPSHEGGIEHG